MENGYSEGIKKEYRHYRTFLISTSAVILVFILVLFAFMGMRSSHMIEQSLLQQARAHVRTIVLTRKWSSDYGGVYVKKGPGMEPNPFLSAPELKCSGGVDMLLKPPAVMTKEISRLADSQDLLSFKITSMEPVNPDNAPDGFELEAFKAFDSGAVEFYRDEKFEGREFFRYMAPLIASEGCLNCHQGYEVGQTRGGLSVRMDVGHTRQAMKKDFMLILTLAIISALALLGAVLYFSDNLIEHINRSRRRIEELIITDELTGLHNRRHLLARSVEEFEQARRLGTGLGCVMFDLDHFKSVNDRFGHLAGDEALRRFAEFLHASIRAYDVLGRFGGEEFLVVLPATDFEETRNFAERMRERLDGMEIELATGQCLNITLSAGVTVMTAQDESVLDVVNRADEAMYRAKQSGRNRVM